MDTSEHESLRKRFKQLSDAIDCCAAKQLTGPALILTYCTIDIASWLYSDKQSVQARFTEWVGKYLLPGSSLKCTALDLYGARCGVVHTDSPASDLSKAGRAVEVAYAWLPSSAADLEKLVGYGVQLGLSGFIAIQADDLIGSLCRGIECFLNDLSIDRELAQRAYLKSSRTFCLLSPEQAAEMRQQAEKIFT